MINPTLLSLFLPNCLTCSANKLSIPVFYWGEKDTESTTLYRTFGTLPELYNYYLLIFLFTMID